MVKKENFQKLQIYFLKFLKNNMHIWRRIRRDLEKVTTPYFCPFKLNKASFETRQASAAVAHLFIDEKQMKFRQSTWP